VKRICRVVLIIGDGSFGDYKGMKGDTARQRKVAMPEYTESSDPGSEESSAVTSIESGC
jgi:hypothetical protein